MRTFLTKEQLLERYNQFPDTENYLEKYKFFTDNFSVDALSKIDGRTLAIRLFSIKENGKIGYFSWAEHGGLGNAGIGKTLNILFNDKDNFYKTINKKPVPIAEETAIECARNVKKIFNSVFELSQRYINEGRLNDIDGYRKLNIELLDLLKKPNSIHKENNISIFYGNDGVTAYILKYLHCNFPNEFSFWYQKGDLRGLLTGVLQQKIEKADNRLVLSGQLALYTKALGVECSSDKFGMLLKSLKEQNVKKAREGANSKQGKEFLTFLRYYQTHFDESGNRLGDKQKYYHDEKNLIPRRKCSESSLMGYKAALENVWDECSKLYSSPYEIEKFSDFQPIMNDALSINEDSDKQLGFKWYGQFLRAIEKGLNVAELESDEQKEKKMENIEDKENKDKETELNLILYGPPGTGKTYHTIPRAMSIIDAKSRGLKYWENEYENNKDRVLTLFNAELKKGYITNGRKYKTGHIAFVTFHQSYGYEEFIEGIKPNITASKAVFYEVADGLFKDLCNRADFDRTEQKNKQQGDWQDANGDPFVANENYVFIIDEINRGNVSKIFGELITLIEPTKRLGAEEEMTCILPYSGDDFGVPKNVYILGTMNTADRSLVQLDAALRRRFAFEEMMPDYAVIKKKVGNEGIVEDVDVARLLESINERITALLDREHQIGHSYFMKVGDARDLAEVFKKKIIPLLQEYFFDDYESIQKVLNEPKDSSGNFIKEGNFIIVKDNPFENGKKIYSIKEEMPEKPEAYKRVYDSIR